MCGSGGAFLHPTHVFSYSRFRPVHDSAAGSLFLPDSKGLSMPHRIFYIENGLCHDVVVTCV